MQFTTRCRKKKQTANYKMHYTCSIIIARCVTKCQHLPLQLVKLMYVYTYVIYRNITWLCKLLRFFSAHLSTVSLGLGPATLTPPTHPTLPQLTAWRFQVPWPWPWQSTKECRNQHETGRAQQNTMNFLYQTLYRIFVLNVSKTWRKDMWEVWSLASSANPLPVHMAQLQIFQLREKLCVKKKNNSHKFPKQCVHHTERFLRYV